MERDYDVYFIQSPSFSSVDVGFEFVSMTRLQSRVFDSTGACILDASTATFISVFALELLPLVIFLPRMRKTLQLADKQNTVLDL